MIKRQSQPSLPAATLLVGISGFAAGAVFGPAVSEASLSPGSMLPAALTGAVLWTGLWFLVSAVIARIGRTGARGLARRLAVWFAIALLPLISYLPYLVHRSGLEGEIAELPPLGSRYSAISLLVWSLLLLAVLLRLALNPGAGRLSRLLTRRPAVTLTVMMAAWVAVFFPLDVLKDQYMQVTTVNSALFREAMTHVLDSRGFMFSNLLYGAGDSLFSVHINAIFLWILPFFRLWPDYRWLLFMSDVAMALSAWPAYLIARRFFSQGLSLLLAAMLLLHPIFTAQPGRSDFSELRFMPVLFLTAFYLFEKKRFWWFAGVSLLMMTIREDMGLFAAFFGIYALMRRRSLKWILAPLAWGLGWFAATFGVLLPRMSPGGADIRASLRYSGLGSSGGEIVRTLLFRPWKAFQVVLSDASHIGVAYGLLLAFGLGIPLLSGAIVMAIPAVAELLFQQTTTFTSFMALTSVPTLMAAFIYGLARLCRILNRWKGIAPERTAAITTVVMFFLALSAFHTWFNPGLYRPRYNYDAALEAFHQVPAGASVIMPEFLLAYAQPGQTVRGFHQVKYSEDISGSFRLTEDYVILDKRIPSRDAGNRYYQGLEEVTCYLSKSPDFHKVFESNDIELYARNGHEPAAGAT